MKHQDRIEWINTAHIADPNMMVNQMMGQGFEYDGNDDDFHPNA